jgi:hypothetical protein
MVNDVAYSDVITIEALLHNKLVPVETTKVFGYSIKWAEKHHWLKQEFEEWAKQPATVYHR